ncbi:MAG: PrgI family protein [bacterium]|nr:PrgI family protein [bacterium]
MRFQVPQFVDIEDKIIGPFTLKQFLIYLFSVMALVPVFLTTDLSLFLTVAIPVIGVAALFAHFKLNGKSLFVVLMSAVRFFLNGQLYLWRRTADDKPLVLRGEEYGGKEGVGAETATSLSERARALETAGNVSKEDASDPLGEEDINQNTTAKTQSV